MDYGTANAIAEACDFITVQEDGRLLTLGQEVTNVPRILKLGLDSL